MNEKEVAKVTFADIVAMLLWWTIKIGCVYWLLWQWGNWSWLPFAGAWSWLSP